MNQVYTLGGRRFTVVGVSTLEHDLWFQAERRRAGLEEVTVHAGETADDFCKRLTNDVVASGRALHLLGGMLMPADVKQWRPRIAKDTAAFLGSLNDEQEKATVRWLILSVLIDFFELGLSSLWSSGTASVTPSLHDGPSPASLSPTADGLDSSAPSPSMTTMPLAA